MIWEHCVRVKGWSEELSTTRTVVLIHQEARRAKQPTMGRAQRSVRYGQQRDLDLQRLPNHGGYSHRRQDRSNGPRGASEDATPGLIV